MNRFRLIAIFFIIGIGLTGSYFIIKNSGSLQEVKPIAGNSGNDLLAQSSPIKWVENTAVNKSNGQSAKAANSYNATDFFAESLFEKLKSSDQVGKDPFISPDPSDLKNQNFIKGVANQLNKETLSFDQTVSDSDLKISADNSKEAKAVYFQAVAEITKNRFNDSKYIRSADQIISDIENDCKGSGPSMNQEVANLYGDLVDDYLNLSTPSDYLSLHKSIIIHFKKSDAVYSALANCFNDPIKGYAAAQELSNLADNTQNIQNVLAKKYKENGLY